MQKFHYPILCRKFHVSREAQEVRFKLTFFRCQLADQRHVAVASLESGLADAAVGWMANEIGLTAAATDLKAIGSVESLRTHFLALLAHEALFANAQTVRLSAPRVVDTLALLLAVVAPRRVGARRLALFALPARQAVANSVDMRTFAAVLAATLVLAIFAVRSFFARMVAGQADVARSALELASDVIASCLRRHIFGASLLTVLTVVAGGAFLIAGPPDPAALAEALPGRWIT